MPARARSLFLQQRPYLPIGTLRDAVAYPAPAIYISGRDHPEGAAASGVGRLETHLDETAQWDSSSPWTSSSADDRSRAPPRADWIFMDDATAALDEPSRKRVYEISHRGFQCHGDVDDPPAATDRRSSTSARRMDDRHGHRLSLSALLVTIDCKRHAFPRHAQALIVHRRRRLVAAATQCLAGGSSTSPWHGKPRCEDLIDALSKVSSSAAVASS